LLLWALPAAAQVSGDTPQPRLGVRPLLSERTYPRFRNATATQFPGGILYAEYADLEGTLLLSGTPAFLASVVEQCEALANDPEGLRQFFSLRVHRLRPDGSVEEELPGTVPRMTLSATDEEFRWSFHIPVEVDSTWREGHYRLQMSLNAEGMMSTQPVYFEVKRVPRHTGEEINLLTNAWLNSPPGLGEKLFQADPSFRGTNPFKRMLRLDPYDVLARKLLANAELYVGRPSRAAMYYREIYELWESGKAHRLEGLLVEPGGSLHPLQRPQTQEEWQSYLEAELNRFEGTAQAYGRAKGEVEAALAADPRGLDSLLASPEPWVSVVAIRTAGERRSGAAVSPLMAMLAEAPIHVQHEIVKALAKIQNSSVTIRDEMHPEDKASVVDRWLRGEIKKRSRPGKKP
jgi:hypothetical protein